MNELALCFRCEDAWLHGIVSMPAAPASRGVVILVGGPQYRVGSHRQFTLLARELAANGTPAFRFDYRGMGDSEGSARSFEDIDADLRAAIDAFLEAVPSMREVVIWGLCDAASAASFYAHQDARVTGLVLLNPWVRTDAGIAKTVLKRYYLSRLASPEMWRKIRRGEFDYVSAARSIGTQAMRAFGRKGQRAGAEPESGASRGPLPERMYDSLTRFHGRLLVILSGNDLTAQEFEGLRDGSPGWRKLFRNRRVRQYRLAEANHTFASQAWRDQVAAWTRDWLRSW